MSYIDGTVGFKRHIVVGVVEEVDAGYLTPALQLGGEDNLLCVGIIIADSGGQFATGTRMKRVADSIDKAIGTGTGGEGEYGCRRSVIAIAKPAYPHLVGGEWHEAVIVDAST